MSEGEGEPQMSAQPPTDESSIGQLVTAIKDDVSQLVRGQIDLAKAEMRDDVKSASVGGAMFAIAALLVLIALVLLSFALVVVVRNTGITTGWSFAIVGGAYVLLAGILAIVGRSALKSAKGPQRTRESVRRTAQAIRPSARS